MVAIFAGLSSMLHAQGEFDPGDYNTLRVENEIKMVVPQPLIDSVWDYLVMRYQDPSAFLMGIDSSLHAVFAEDLFHDQYFDNDTFLLARMQCGVRHRKREVLSDTLSAKNGRELMQIKINHIDGNALNRGEFKYPVHHYKPGGKVKAYDDHPFLGLVKRKRRPEIMQQLKAYGIDALTLAPTIVIRQYRKRLYVRSDSSAFATLTLDIDTAYYDGREYAFTELEMELNEIAYTLGDTTRRATMESKNAMFQQDLLARFPAIYQDQTPKYNKAARAFGIDPQNGLYGKGGFPWLIATLIGVVVVGGVGVFFWRMRRAKG